MSKIKKMLTYALVILAGTVGAVALIQSPAAAGWISGGPLFGPYSIRASDGAGNQKCLDVAGISQANGALLQMYDCLGTGQTNQQFYFWDIEGSPYYQITPSHSWKCLDVVGVSHDQYARIQQYDCLGAGQANQVWDVWFDDRPGYNAWHIVATHSWQSMGRDYPVNGAAVYQVNQGYIWSLCSGSC